MAMLISEAATQLLGAARNVAVAAKPIPSGEEYSRKFATSTRIRQRTEQLDEKVALLTNRLLALNGAGGKQDVSQVVSVLLRRAHRREGTSGGDRPKRKAETPLSDDRSAKIAKNGMLASRATSDQNFAVEFRPNLEAKPHDIGADATVESQPKPVPPLAATKSLRQWYKIVMEHQSAGLNELKPGYHPYRSELKAWLAFCERGEDQWDYGFADEMRELLFSPTKFVVEKPSPKVFDIRLITDAKTLEEMIDHIFATKARVISVDVEHHSTFSYRGKTCLVQIGVGSIDYIIDPLKLSTSTVTTLNQIFTCPSILKVLHGSQYDILWLQQDYSLYFVATFDTYFACLLLRMPGGNSLANLIKVCCDVEVDKTLQTADWRERPLTQEMQHYAAGDTHYLVYIFTKMRNEILSGRNDMCSLPPCPNGISHIGMKRMLTILEQSRLLCLNTVNFGYPDLATLRHSFELKFGLRESKGNETLNVLFIWRDWAARIGDVAPRTILNDLGVWSVWNQIQQNRSDSILTSLHSSFSTVGYRLWPQCLNLLSELQSESDSLPTGPSERGQVEPGRVSSVALLRAPLLQAMSQSVAVLISGAYWNTREGSLHSFRKSVGRRSLQSCKKANGTGPPMTRLHLL